jgi:FtsP/CotA-like multicopper oxidase with cupredoxin domain
MIDSSDGGDVQIPERRAAADRREISRRGFLAASAGTLALAGLPASPAAAQAGGHAVHGEAAEGEAPGLATVRRVPFTPGEPLVEPEVRRSVNGELSTTLRVRYAWNDIGGYRLFTRTYEGTVPGPTLRVKSGDTLRIRLVNELPPNREPLPAYVDQPHGHNTTNLHFHGSHVSPGGISDNVLRSMQPVASYDIQFDLPDDHPKGTYWYHPHHHGSADIQMASGMVAAVVIEGDFDDVPEIAAARERLLVLSEVVYDAFGMVEGFDTLFPETAARFFTINGQRLPTISMRPGEVQRWRLLHAGYQDDFFLELQGHKLHPIARDGIQLARMDMPEIRTAEHAGDDPDAILIVPGQRIDVLVQAGAAGAYDLVGLPYDQGYPSPTGPFARVVVEGEPLPMRLPASLPPPPLKAIADEEITGRRTLTFSAVTPEADAAGHWQEFRFMIDGKVFDPSRVDQRIRLGAVEEWTVVNEHKDDHVFHIHVNPFQLVKVNDRPVEPVWLDTVPLPRFGSVTFRSRFEHFAGKFVLHCHMMNHEELGMMQMVEVFES